jgi:hypothetical protein
MENRENQQISARVFCASEFSGFTYMTSSEVYKIRE